MQLNTLDEPADMFFRLTESPWIRAGRQYTVRVSFINYAGCPRPPELLSLSRTFGRIQTTALQFATSQRMLFRRTVLWHCSFKTRVTSRMTCGRPVLCWSGACILTELASTNECLNTEGFFQVMYISLYHHCMLTIFHWTLYG